MTSLLITGGCGFIASNFINQFFDSYPHLNFVNIDAMYYCASEDNILPHIRISPRYTLIKGNLNNLNLDEIFTSRNIRFIIHFAAQSHVQNSFSDAVQYTLDNVLATHRLLETTRLYGKVEKIIHISTDEVYGESMISSEEKEKTEESILCPTNPYAATKAGAELVVQAYYHSFKIPIIITRGNNVFGPNQYPEKLVPKFIKQLQENQKVTIQGDGSNLRSFLYVTDVCEGLNLIFQKGKIGEIYNIGSDEHNEKSVLDVAKILIKAIKNTENYDEWISFIEDRPFNDKRYYISNKKLKNLGWEIKVEFLDGINKLI